MHAHIIEHMHKACYGVLRFVMESGAKGCEVIVSGKLRAQRAKAMKFKDGYMISSGQPVNEYIDSAVRHVLLRQGVLGIKVKIMLDWDPKGKVGPITPLPDLVTIHTPKEEEEYNFTPALAAKEGRNLRVIITTTVTIGAIAIASTAFFFWRWMAKKKRAMKIKSNESLLFDYLNDVKLQDLPIFNLEELAKATNNFDMANKLGQGGFGPVYRGKLHNGQEIAVKRLYIYIRLANLEFEEDRNLRVIITITVTIGVIAIASTAFLFWRWMAKKKRAMKSKSNESLLFDYLNDVKLQDLPIFNLEEMAKATNNFDMANKLGQGGFGPVYRGKLHNGQEIAVKRLCRAFGQGLEEFMNEMALITKLQHRNLVRLLDQELNPKISDFGMARIFGGNEDQVKTKRVVGTYGYMSPEYAMRGLFSEKSDIFSFGVLLLEIVSGRRNTSICDEEQYLGLIGLAWKLWNNDNIMALVDPTIWDPCFQVDISKCIHVGLLCVQELARDRPNVYTVISMLKSEILDMPTPKQPAFMERQIVSNLELTQQGQIRFSNCNVTTSTVSGR
ncbi:hypothetical protein CMV_029751 [Castanea mollissima]|uniref:Protein kinase domain-containing protein n=1 Tax=Castanea mollissima TaxID=60419 RepID=A0A8J4Q795_9ROSI|nr:hypothetical protein CMV_029751 [Castanea mollissima]